MPKAFVIEAPGGLEALQWRDLAVPEPADHEVLIKHGAVGLSFLDVQYRNGTLAAPAAPFTPGMEGCGVVIRPGKATQHVMVGDRVAYAMGPLGAYAEYRVIPENCLVRVPNDLTDEQVAAVLLRGLTAHYLVKRTYLVNEASTVLVHAAAGGVGSLVCQWAKYLGATVIGTVGSAGKVAFAQSMMCDLVVDVSQPGWVKQVRDFTKGAGVNVVYDGVGRSVFDGSLDCLTRFGMMVSYGQSSGPVPLVEIGILRDKGSLFLTRPSLADYKDDFSEYHLSAAEVFDMVLRRHLRLHIGQTFHLKDAVKAHQALETRATKGLSALLVGAEKTA